MLANPVRMVDFLWRIYAYSSSTAYLVLSYCILLIRDRIIDTKYITNQETARLVVEEEGVCYLPWGSRYRNIEPRSCTVFNITLAHLHSLSHSSTLTITRLHSILLVYTQRDMSDT